MPEREGVGIPDADRLRTRQQRARQQCSRSQECASGCARNGRPRFVFRAKQTGVENFIGTGESHSS
eukprot:751611-Pleurochrysis_carterae.AAC.1